MLKLVVLVLHVLGLVQSGVGQIIQSGQCDPNVGLVTDFDIDQFAGQWFEIAKSDIDVRTADCSYFEFIVGDNDVQVRNLGVNANFEQDRNGDAGWVNGTAIFNLNLSPPEESFEFLILLTNYNDFTLAYNCENISPTERSVNVWQLGRTTSAPNEMMQAMMNTALSNYLDISLQDLRTVDHSDDACFILPIIEPGEPIILSGQCDENINAVENFDPGRFVGVWHEIAAYESVNSLNLCARAEYTAGDGIILVENSQVINETLVSIFGSASVISTDGSARLSVTLDVGGVNVTSELKILATDYDSYAVSYTCENLSDNRQRIYSWILGRSRQLSAQTQAAVDAVVQSTIVLNYQYYRQTDQSDEACFFYPEHVPNTPVVFRGLCNMDISTVSDFDPERYTGIWHDIESYHSAFQTGTCRNAEYQLASDFVSVLNTQVINQTLDSIVGEARLAFTDGSGKLNVTFPVAGSNVTVSTNYWILDTDYTSYALVYSCVNLDENQRQVWTWKLSRTKELTTEASTAINNVISDIPVLDQQYYQRVDQSVEGCFFFPEPRPGVPVVFPGQCDNSINAVQNFDLTQFSGTWYEIEAYPKEQQQGQCISHVYTQGDGNTLDLQSSQITDQFLGISNGTLRFDSTDGSARMNIDINVDGETITIPFWVLNTDYNDYALAYSCVQLNSDFRGIYSWKLSRQQELSVNAQTAISAALADVEVLDQGYYEPIDQSHDACFHLPELAPGEPIVLVGQCDPDITTVENFDAGRYLGRWYLIESYPSVFQNGTCNDAQYSLGANGTVDVFNTQVIDQALDTIVGSAVASADGTGKLLVTFPGASEPSDYWILDTDYVSYALVYSCVNISSDLRQIWSWKLSRTQDLSASAVTAIDQVIDTINVLNNRYYAVMDHTPQGCFYFPEPDSSTMVRFRGRCNDSIPAVQNFNVESYLGLWHLIESYPSSFQTGTCNNAQYSLGSAGVDVFNTQVVNQTLDTMSGLAVVASADGSARLNVSFPIAGTNQTTQTPYWVLETDYSSYSLVYTCVEVDEEYKQVLSWKLSRNKELSAAAESAINSVTSGIQVLDERYYQPMDQSRAGCFYYPEPQAGVPVVFPGQCEDIDVVQNFNLTAFEGIWHEIEAYPKEQQQGQCVSHQYASGTGNTLDLQSSQVIDLAQIISIGTLSFTSTDGSARLSITINANGTAVTIPFWILDTNYDDYALAYSCVNQNDDYRGIYSWKLSRNRQLSSNAGTAINNTMSTVDVLRQEYFEPIGQTDEDCFFLPETEAGEVVVFPGQCDPNITVVQNFSAANYLGRWYLIESYPSAFQNGSCNDARYSPGANGVVDVLNTQVVDQNLETVVGIAEASTDGTGKLLVTFPNAPGPSDYWILDTDYTSYALVYSCANINSEQRAVWSWKLSRSQSLTSNAIDSINQVIDSVNVLNDRYYEVLDHSPQGCFYFPQPDPFTLVRFRGRCDDSISAMQDFDVASYLGLWHLIESYPSSFQTGTCNNAQYSLGSAGVDVFNTQVVNQTLDTMSGLAVVASADGSGRLNVSFPIAGTNQTTQTPYWVLDTDYSSYSLVYTCVEVDEEYKQVLSWKLSRNKELSAAAESAINSVTSGIQVLDERYYQPMDQSRAGCFYYPEPQAGVPVVFPGQCENIDVVQNFNLTAFEGIWHEIEAYPKEQQQGQCVSHQYASGTGNTLDLQSLQVIDLALGVSNGTLAFTSTDGSARMSITIDTAGGVVTIPFWIVDTDYTDYALAYSCVNQGDDYQSVYSWKLSRNRLLSSEAGTAISNAMSAVDVIDDRYFEPIDQSDDACFYLPALSPGEPVIFPGQCDMGIPAVQNFDAARYLGRWRLIETYAAEFQNGECQEATYSPADDGSVDVFNTEVIDQRLDTISGTAQLASTDGSGQLLVTFPNSTEPATYWILATDYDSYSLVYSCRNVNAEQRRVWAWKLSRDRSLSANAINSINQVMNGINVLNDQYFEQVQQNDDACFYYPQPDGRPVTFRGQCDENVAVVTDFDPERYEGVWYDVESYPQDFQEGTCPIAAYTLDGAVVRVRNTQVVAQELDVIEGTAELAGNAGEAKLQVTFPVAGTDLTVVSPYWVLATDYTNYSLVYSCQNIDDETRRVSSWKLSRTQSLTAASSSAITAAMNAVPVLDQQYYATREHSEEACFYYPDNQGGPVLLNGQCESDDQVDVISNFDPARFQGTWHEISRFPWSRQVGQCASSQYSYSEGALSLTQSIVYNERLTSVEGPVTASADGAGILTVDLVGHDDVRINDRVYILDVDYDDYALLYSCRNYNSTTMQVYSWKLSRFRDGLSQAATERIDEIVDSTPNLFFRYYEHTAQDDYACFYYPEFETLPEAITLPGPCNTTIRGISDFDAERYLGYWFEIEKYPQPWQEGECPRAQYSDAGGAVSVLNTQVVNRTLLSQEGTAVVASTDGSGQLTVTFDVNGVINTANYYIMATDYDSYALVYSCRDLEDGNRQVSSWKLGRTRTFSAEANNAIASAIESTQGLLQDYYTVTDQSWDACFYIPESDPERPVRFRGTCDGISGQANFDMQRYLGWWHEVNSYPTGNDTGSCFNTQYQQAGNQIEFVDTQVFDLEGQVTRGTVVASNNGRLTRTLANGETQDIWVIATDYDSYSLVFSCNEVDDEYVQVWSSMQSKTRSLTEAAEQAIASAIAGNDFLVEELFLPVDLSDGACFHYPEQLGARVRLPGQCDDNIPVQTDFDIVRYSGVWYQIERYPYPEVSDDSTCIGTRYRYDAVTGVVDILNWEVVDGELNSIEGSATVSNETAKMEVVLPVPGSEDATSATDLYILATDYASYSLVYTCENVNQFQREVVALKLSRNRTMPASATTAINAYMASREELHQPLFISVEQNEDCEEPSSAFLVKSSLLLVLVCYALQMLM